MHPGSRLREKKESEIQPAWERGGNPLEPVSVILQDITDALLNFTNYKYLGVSLLFPNMETRTCKECGAEHPLDLSYFPSAGKIKGVQYYRYKCISCYSKQKTKEAGVRIDKFREYKKTLKCNRCGYDDYRALEFHHPDDNKEGHPCVIARQKSWENVMKELNKCEVLCSNCHRIEHYTGH